MDHRDREQRIRERAYQIWVQEGRPEGRAEAHWEEARELEGQAEVSPGATRPNPAGREESAEASGHPAERPESMAVHGDLPGLSDQGRETPVPPSRRARRAVAEEGHAMVQRRTTRTRRKSE